MHKFEIADNRLQQVKDECAKRYSKIEEVKRKVENELNETKKRLVELD